MAHSRQQLVYKLRHALRKERKPLCIPLTAVTSNGICVRDESLMALLESHSSIDYLSERLQITYQNSLLSEQIVDQTIMCS